MYQEEFDRISQLLNRLRIDAKAQAESEHREQLARAREEAEAAIKAEVERLKNG